MLPEDADVSPPEPSSSEPEDPPGCTDTLLPEGSVAVAEVLGVESTVSEEVGAVLVAVAVEVALLDAAFVAWVVVADGATLLVPVASVVEVVNWSSVVVPSEQADSSGIRTLAATKNVALWRLEIRFIGTLRSV